MGGCPMTSVFVSHSSLDHDQVRTQVVDLLASHGLDVWYSRDSIHAAEEWEKRIRHALASCEWFLVALSTASVQSEWVRAEVDWALENRRGKVVPVLIDDCDPQDCHLRLRQIQHIDLRGDNPRGRSALLGVWGLESPPAGSGTPPPGPSPWEDRSRHVGTRRRGRTPWVAGGAVLLTAAALGAWSAYRGPAETRAPEHEAMPTAGPGALSAVAPSTPAKAETATPSPRAPAAAKEEPPPVVVELGLDQPASPPAGIAPEAEDTRVTYQYERKDGVLHVSYRLPYLDRQREGKAIRGLSRMLEPFDWKLPALSVKVLNNSAQSVMLTECVAEVTASRVDTEPVLVVASGAVNAVFFANEGWGDVVDPVLTFKISPMKEKGDEASAAVERHTLELKSFAKDCRVPLVKYVPKALEDDPAVLVTGELEFGPAPGRKKVPFTTTMIFDITHGSPIPPSYTYDLKLTAGKAPDAVRVPVSQSLKPGEADHFLLRIASDKSAHYEMKLRFTAIDGRALPGRDVVLDVFVPRGMAGRAEKVPPPGAVPAAEAPQ